MAVHVAGPALARRLRRLDISADAIIAFADNLLIGPSTREHVRLGEVRGQYWRGISMSPRNLRATYSRLVDALTSDGDVIVWSSGSLQHAVLLWMVCALRDGRSASVLEIAPQRADEGPDNRFGCIERELRSDEVRAFLGNEVTLDADTRHAAARSWRSFAGPAPTEFNEHCRAAAPTLDQIGRYHAGFFPRSTAKGLRVSVFDELLLACVSEAWSLPSEILLRRTPEGRELRSWLACAGDIFVGRRLREWACHAMADPILEREAGEGDQVLTGVRYRLSPRGLALLEQGIRSVADAPACPIGGGAAYDPEAPVAATAEGDWRLERL